jgi:predicted nucleic acid-binding protein
MTIHEKSGTLMAGSAPDSAPRAYLDTNLIIGLAENDLARTEMTAMEELLQRHKGRETRLCTSHVAKEELSRRRPAVNGRLRRLIYRLARRSPGNGRVQKLIYDLLDDIPAVDEQFLAPPMLGSAALGSAGPIVKDELLGKLSQLLPGEDDARHIFQAARNGIDYFVTCDRRTILKHAAKVESVVPIKLRSPSQLVADLASIES